MPTFPKIHKWRDVTSAAAHSRTGTIWRTTALHIERAKCSTGAFPSAAKDTRRRRGCKSTRCDSSLGLRPLASASDCRHVMPHSVSARKSSLCGISTLRSRRPRQLRVRPTTHTQRAPKHPPPPRAQSKAQMNVTARQQSPLSVTGRSATAARALSRPRPYSANTSPGTKGGHWSFVPPQGAGMDTRRRVR